MSPARQPHRKPPQRGAKKPSSADAPTSRRTQVRLRRHASGGVWELVHPPCALERADDLEEVRAMIDAGEADVAVDELRWLLTGCSDFIEAHRMLGELALESDDPHLARAHFGYAYDLGLWSFAEGKPPGPLPYRLPANQAFLEAAKGLAYCLNQLGKRAEANPVIQTLLACDPTDPLGVRAWLDETESNTETR